MNRYDGEHTTPKQLAETILYDAIAGKMEFFLEDAELDLLTDAEKEKVYDQAVKVADRLTKMLHYDARTNSWHR